MIDVKKQHSLVRQIITLLVIALVCGGLLGLSYYFLKTEETPENGIALVTLEKAYKTGVTYQMQTLEESKTENSSTSGSRTLTETITHHYKVSDGANLFRLEVYNGFGAAAIIVTITADLDAVVYLLSNDPEFYTGSLSIENGKVDMTNISSASRYTKASINNAVAFAESYLA